MSTTYNVGRYCSINAAARTCAVALVTFVALAISLPNLLETSNPLMLGDFDFFTSDNAVLYAGPVATAAGIAAGDRIDYARMPPQERYGSIFDGVRSPVAGQRVKFVVDRHGSEHLARVKAVSASWKVGWGDLTLILRFVAQKAVFFVLVLLASALVSIRPSPATGAFFLFVAGNGVVPEMYSFLPPSAFAAVMAIDDALAGLGAIGFLALAFYVDPGIRIGRRLAFAVMAALLAVIVAPIAGSDVLEVVGGARPSWPLAGWASFLAVWSCYALGCIIMVRLATCRNRPANLRLLAVVLAAVGVATIFDWTLSVQPNTWYFVNLPGAVMNRGIIFEHDPLLPIWFYTGSLFVLRLLGALLAFNVFVRGGIAHAGPVYHRIVNYVIAALLTVAFFLATNIMLMPHVSSYAWIVPAEIVVALVIGYWVSGLRDLSGSLSLACITHGALGLKADLLKSAMRWRNPYVWRSERGGGRSLPKRERRSHLRHGVMAKTAPSIKRPLPCSRWCADTGCRASEPSPTQRPPTAARQISARGIFPNGKLEPRSCYRAGPTMRCTRSS